MSESINDPFKTLNEFKRKLNVDSLKFEDLIQDLENKSPAIVQYPKKGEIGLLYFDGNISKLYLEAKDVPENIPALEELTKVLKDKVKNITLVGEAFYEGKNLNIIIFDILELNNKKLEETYWKRYLLIESFFKGCKYLYPMASKLESNDAENFWENVSAGLTDGYVIHDNNSIGTELLNTQKLVVIGVLIKNDKVNSIIVAYMPESDVFYYAGKIGKGITEEQQKEWYDLAMSCSVENKKDIIFVDPYKFNKVVKIASTALLLDKRPVFKLENNELNSLDNQLSAIGKDSMLIEVCEESIKPSTVGIDQIPNYPNKDIKDHKIATYTLPKKLASDFFNKHKMLNRDNLYSYYNSVDKESQLKIKNWFDQKGYKVIAGDDTLLMTDGVTVYEWKPNMAKKADQDGNSAPYWISDIDPEQLFPEEMYQMRQYPFMMPSSRDNDALMDGDSDRWERLHTVKWYS